ncbi:MAG: phosphoribosylanthranilate isomerase [Bacteroidales bacterium]|nr:phosphoribosylanthranilate isomerase [Bacteroidales bacterium]
MANRIKIKVCGMREFQNINQLVELNPDYIGFIFYPNSKRFAGKKISSKILKIIPKEIKKVGVFVNEELEKLKKIVKKNQIDFVQLHGNETPDFCKNVKESNISIIKSFSINERFNFKIMENYKEYCDFFLFDTFTIYFGGSGEKFNWEILKNYDNEIPVFLSGGISPDDIDAIDKLTWLNIHAVDINSKFETEPGLKNIEKVQQFIKAVRNE